MPPCHVALPKDLMEIQLGEVDLLQAMYASDNEIHIDESSHNLLQSLRNWCEGDDTSPPDFVEAAISLYIDLTFPVPSGGSRCLELGVSVPVAVQDDDTMTMLEDAGHLKSRVWARQSAWMSKAEAAELNCGIPNDDTLGAIEYVKEAASRLSERSQNNISETSPPDGDIILSRVWFYFPSISTRSKRDDIVNHAPTYGLTGFLLAGKPGILCLEGDSQAIDNYMKFIKTESWNDIPSQHKKVSERYREEGTYVSRAFQDMQEITEEFVDTRRGARGNRNDMSVLKAWLDEHGVGDAFEKLFI